MKGEMKPVMGIMVYKGGDEYYLEKRKTIKTNSGDYRLGVGGPLKRTTLHRLLSTLIKKEKSVKSFKGVIPNNVLHYQSNYDGFKLTWLMKSQPQHLSFAKGLNIPNGIADIPHLIFKIEGNSIYVAAVKTTNIKEDTIVYMPPFHNMSSEGSLCKGSGKYSTRSEYFEDIMSAVEQGFFNSMFSHHNYGKVAKCNINLMWKQLIETGAKFNNDMLVPMNIKFIDFAKK